jgi:hypothetical protein
MASLSVRFTVGGLGVIKEQNSTDLVAMRILGIYEPGQGALDRKDGIESRRTLRQ